MIRHRRSWLMLYQWAAGLCDASTGLLLILAPAWTLRLMGIKLLPQPIAFASFIGAFVMSVGLTYLWVAIRWPISRAAANRWQTQWIITALVRTVIALFILSEVVTGTMESTWITVSLSDGVLAIIQWFGLSRGWLNVAD